MTLVQEAQAVLDFPEFIWSVNHLDQLLGESPLRNSFGSVFFVFDHNTCNVFELDEGQKLKVSLDIRIRGPEQELNRSDMGVALKRWHWRTYLVEFHGTCAVFIKPYGVPS